MRRLAYLMVALALVAGACGGGKSSAKTTAGVSPGVSPSVSPSGAQTYTVNIEGNTNAFKAEIALFFPDKLSAHPGDTVKFDLVHTSGVPHTVTFGSLVNAAVAKLNQLGPTASLAAQENSPEMLNLPDVFNHKNPTNGPPDANQSAAQPCFLATGVPPLSLTGSAPACPKTAQPDFDGTQSFYNSGVLGTVRDTFTVRLSPNIKPGTYSLMCLIHRSVMTGSITVAPKATPVPGPDAVTADGTNQFNAMVADVTPVSQAAQTKTANNAVLGSGDPVHYPSVVLAEFGPKTLSIPVGGTVTWNEFAFHTVSLGSAAADVGLLNKAPDGSVHFAPKSGAPVGFNTPPALFEFPPPDNGKPVAVSYTYPGSGFANSGITGSLPPVFITFKVTFAKAGTYTARCLVHNDMTATVKVG